MTEGPEGYSNKKDDLDLILLAEKLFSFWNRNGKIILISAFTGLIAGLLLFVITPNTYSSSLLLHSFTLTNTEHINIIENWDELLKKHEYEALSKDLNCDVETLKKVKKLSASEIQKLYIQNNPNGFMVEVIVSDNNILETLQKGIIHGLENGSYIKEKLSTKKSNLNQLIEKTNKEIIKLDSTKQNVEKSINSQNKGSSSYIVDISSINSQMIYLNEKLLGYREELKFANAVQVLHDFSKFTHPESPKLVKLLVLGFIAGFAIGYFISVYRYLHRKVYHGTKL